MVAISRLSGGIAALAIGGAALIAAPAAAFAQPAATVVVPCSTSDLVSAINAANTALTPTTLQLTSNCSYSIFLPASVLAGLPPIKNDITLMGGSNTVIRRSAFTPAFFRLFDVTSAGDLTISNLTLTNGYSLVGDGGAIWDGGGLTVTNSTITGNTARSGGGVYVFNGASAEISSTLMNQNRATNGTGGGGAIQTAGFLELFKTVVDSNSASGNGGGLYVQPSGRLFTEQTTITNNTAGKVGGGIYNRGSVSLNGTQVRLNSAFSAGGIASTNTNVTLASTIVKKNTPDNCPAGLFCQN
jgi:Right handed beta helix region/Chlamydia polymorphic membrane protein (Chlamydia_PMP) repeat